MLMTESSGDLGRLESERNSQGTWFNLFLLYLRNSFNSVPTNGSASNLKFHRLLCKCFFDLQSFSPNV